MEKLMQYVWEHRLWPPQRMTTTDGRRIRILNAGLLNRDAGPDFSNASVKIGDETWYGNIEIHVRASDWFRHHHDTDPAYQSVILHVVEVDDAEIHRPDGNIIPQMVMTCARDFNRRYIDFVNNPLLDMPCALELAGMPPILLHDWVTALGMERLQEKADRVTALALTDGWADAMYITLARALGFGTNSEPFELLAKTTPLKALRRHADDLLAVESILFGQAGMLATDGAPASAPGMSPAATSSATGTSPAVTGSPTGMSTSAAGSPARANENQYIDLLRREYAFYSAKYGLQPSPYIQWKMARMRPQNFPHRRIATLAALVAGAFEFSHNIAEIKDLQQARDVFSTISLTGFWSTHCNFNSPVPQNTRALSAASVDVLVINAIIPYLYAYGHYTCNDTLTERAVDMLYALGPENNNIVGGFKRAGVAVGDAFTSQALIQLNKHYCRQRKCLFCRLGHRMLSAKVARN